MKVLLLFILLLVRLVSQGQVQTEQWQLDLPQFRQVSHPFMPPITSEYFFFSQDNLIWFSTAQGLASFDGSEVVVHTTLAESNLYGLNRISAIAEDAEHNLYIGSYTGLYFFDRKKHSIHPIQYFFPGKKEPATLLVGALYYDRNSSIYVGTVTHGFFRYDTKNRRLTHYNILAGKPDDWAEYRVNTVRSFVPHYSDPSKLWVGTYDGIVQFDEKTHIVLRNFKVTDPAYQYFPSGEVIHFDVQKMDVESDSIIWFNSWTHGFGRYNTHTGLAKMFFYNTRLAQPKRAIGYIIPSMERYAQGKYIIGVYDGRSILFDARTGRSVYFKVSGNSSDLEQTRYVSRDNNGNVWVLQKGQLYVTLPDHLRLKTRDLPQVDHIYFPQLRGMFFDSLKSQFAGAIYVGDGVRIYDTFFVQKRILKVPSTNNTFTYNTSILNTVAVDKQGAYLAIGDHVYWCPENGTEFILAAKHFPKLSGLSGGGDLVDIQVGPNGDMLFRKNGSTLYIIDPVSGEMDSIGISTKAQPGIEIKTAISWYDKRNGYAYLSQKAGIVQYDIAHSKQRPVPVKSLFGGLPPEQGVCVSALDDHGGLWFLIPKYGLRLIDPQTLLCVDSIPFGERGLIRGDYVSFIGSENSVLLFRALNGMVAYDYNRQLSFLFDRGNGLISPEIKSFFYCHGYVFIGLMGGFQYYKLADLSKYILPLKPVLNSIIADTLQVYTRSGADSPVEISLPHYQRSLRFNFSASEFFFPERIEYAYQLEGVDNDWKYTNSRDRIVSYGNLKPGKYNFRIKAQRWGGNWNVQDQEYVIHIQPAFWQESWFEILEFLFVICLLVLINGWRERFIKRREARRLAHEKELSELEAQALRAQMNPHFIFNCLNSIKVLIQDKENEKGILYLTTFSKLIRTLFNNADKKEITLFDEVETCKYYLQLESMRFDSRFAYMINIDPQIDLKSVTVPALVIQPFIENAIWHGIMPRAKGGAVTLSVRNINKTVQIEIDDNGIGREASRQNKNSGGAEHQSKGVGLTEARLKLDNLLNQRDAQIKITDKKDIHGEPLGTNVLIILNEE